MSETTTTGTTASPPARASVIAQIGLVLSLLLFAGTLALPIAAALVLLLALGFALVASFAIRDAGTFSQLAFTNAATVATGLVVAGAFYLYGRRAVAWLATKDKNPPALPPPSAPWTARHPWITLSGLSVIAAFLTTRTAIAGRTPELRWLADAALLAAFASLTVGVGWTGARWSWAIMGALFRLGRGSGYRAGLFTATAAMCGLGAMVAPQLLASARSGGATAPPRVSAFLRRITHSLAETGSTSDRERRFLYRLSLIEPHQSSALGTVNEMGAAASISDPLEPPAGIGRGRGVFDDDGGGGGGPGGGGDGGDGGDFAACIELLMNEEDKVRITVSVGYRQQLSDDDIFDTVRDALLAICQRQASKPYPNLLGAFVRAAQNRLKDRVKGGRHLYETACDVDAGAVACRLPAYTPEDVRLDTEWRVLKKLWCRLTDEEREVIVSRHADDMAFAEVAEQRGITERRARDIYSNSLKKLRLWWRQECPDAF